MYRIDLSWGKGDIALFEFAFNVSEYMLLVELNVGVRSCFLFPHLRVKISHILSIRVSSGTFDTLMVSELKKFFPLSVEKGKCRLVFLPSPVVAL